MMEKTFKVLLAVLTVSAAFCLAGAEDLPVFGKIKIRVYLQDPPRVKMNSVSGGSGKLLMTNRKWGVVCVDFSPGIQQGKSHGRKTKGVWLDDVTMALQVILADSESKKSTGYALFDGRCDFWTIALDNREHTASMFIAPQILERYLPARRTSGTVRSAQTTDFKVRVIFFHKKYGVMGEGYYGFTGSALSKKRKDFIAMKERIGARNTLNGALLTGSRTPWGVNNMGDYDLVKPETVLPALNEEALEKAAQEAEAKEQQESEKGQKKPVSSSSSSSTKKKKR